MELNLKILSESRLFPSTPHQTPTTVPLSIIDAIVLEFTPSETILLYDAPAQDSAFLTSDHFRKALEKTLDSYPQWAGSLKRSNYCPESTDHTERYGRLRITFGRPEDPGVVFVVANADLALCSLIPSGKQRADTMRAWNASTFPGKSLVPQNSLSTSNLDDTTLPSLVVQVTRFVCGGVAIALKFAHPLTDAHAMAHFLRDWATKSRAMAAGIPTPQLSPIFDPQMLDRSAAGDIDAAQADRELLAKAQNLPCHQYDWWLSGKKCPGELQSLPPDPPGKSMPWSEWDMEAPVSHYVLHFSGPELTRMWEAVSHPDTPVSRQGALLAHIWACVVRARGLENDEELVHMDYTLGLRGRTNPPLPDRFVGSPLMLAAISTSGSEAAKDPPTELAASIRSTVAQFTPENIAAFLHAKIHEQCPQRIWQAFLGKRHLLVTSWIHTRMYDVDFGSGRPRYVEAVMPKLDGLLQLMEAAPSEERSEGAKKRHWADDGVDLQLHLKTDVMDRLLSDPLLRKYAER